MILFQLNTQIVWNYKNYSTRIMSALGKLQNEVAIQFNPLRSITAFLTAFLIGWHLNLGNAEPIPYLDSLLKNYTPILTTSLIGLKIDTSFVLTNQLVTLFYNRMSYHRGGGVKYCTHAWPSIFKTTPEGPKRVCLFTKITTPKQVLARF